MLTLCVKLGESYTSGSDKSDRRAGNCLCRYGKQGRAMLQHRRHTVLCGGCTDADNLCRWESRTKIHTWDLLRGLVSIWNGLPAWREVGGLHLSGLHKQRCDRNGVIEIQHPLLIVSDRHLHMAVIMGAEELISLSNNAMNSLAELDTSAQHRHVSHVSSVAVPVTAIGSKPSFRPTDDVRSNVQTDNSA